MGKLLEWPISEDMIGKKVRFVGYSNRIHTHWGFEEGEVYIVGTCRFGRIGPMNKRNEAPDTNWGFIFEIVDEEKDDGETHVWSVIRELMLTGRFTLGYTRLGDSEEIVLEPKEG